ncbi:MAG: ABC transporter substrate-binding protein [Caulobacterales bacterium]
MKEGAKVAGALAAGLALLAAVQSGGARAASADPGAVQIDGFDNALIETMKAGPALGLKGRYQKLAPVVARTFDIPTMIRFAVGADWPSIPAAQQQALTDAFQRLTIASYAHNFASYSGERFEVQPNVLTRGPDKVVQTRLLPAHDQPVLIGYRMRQSGGVWKVIDVYYNGSISQLTTRHADFAATLASGGAGALITHLNALVDKELK